MNEKSLRVLEYNKIIDLLKKKASSSLGLKYIESLVPNTDFVEVKSMLEETSEAQSIIIKRGSVGLDGIHDIEDKVKRAYIGASLDPGSLIMIADTLRVARRLKNSLSSSDEEDFNYPIIQSLSNSLYVYKDIEDQIYNAIISEVEISDNASSTLRDIRRRIAQKNQSIRSKLNSIISSTTYQKYLQDAIISLRGDRFVVPVKSEYRSQVAGIVHDQSSSGATLFIEPMTIVEMNNELRQLKLGEQEEIERILSELSAMVGEVSEDLISNQEILGRLDFAFSKGKLSIQMRGIEPTLNEDKYLNIKNGRHPLLDKKKVVANTIYLGRDFHTLVITGPNTGGKTVTIKTVGLFALMTQSGLHIPADYGSSMCVYDNVFADIGDEQSIEQSLSTFSSHMTNIVSILKNVTADSLVIFDELGAGTDPVEGAALAIAVLEDINSVGAKCIATTHYSELKNYALTKSGVENAAVEFDIETLSPTYKLLIGVPGKSNAFEISRKLGLSDYVISRAKEYINTDNIALEDVLQNVEKNRIKAIEDREEAERLKEEIERLKVEYDEKLEKLVTQRDKMIEKAKSEAFSITRQAKEEVDLIIKELRSLEQERASKEKNRKIEELRKELTSSMGSLQPTVKSMIVPKVSSKEIKDLKPGEEVKVITLNQNGSVVSVDKKRKEAVVQIGIMKMTLPFKSLQKSHKDVSKNVTKSTRNIIRAKSGNIKSEVDLRGLNLEEAIMEVEKYLDDAYVAGLESVTVIHGIGTGVLKAGLQDILRKNRHVKSQRGGQYGEGGAGVTIVKLK
ncbi:MULTISPECIES: endonuclease MutS2 [unclassified Clostridioides]|uniref:endonuclease MutS2 n=1 Tax=unclassified Clostridioides TaxID=2635829 RepID=UPI001D10C1AB|nr:endonuclease MutS2 [Clostridioides sp. ZZV14-6150]MCC0661407.1 endonuclease MutS2 [Clostridioides sp. ZZV14-6154]MCC0717967.1 endonuclease MutS2 [Clostridioides sp. ZZV14-6105]MCC0721947.1 endonuclease MutS2 [Clostridioides sp. ZZV14-6104]MCC0726028.1 endonuclease MutS2 [Clostridioides sp. ZZV14-6045]MCC0731797.1 endonuclease MutS2 [Clostridioides sp. ZZV14-6048]MCC0735125.1 endonuclease MutS2 [Clostridioides sp. ZZV14-6009]MCC0738905.1 endonuclease MutS2 [Clostridioides sp. ZZV14-5902]M